MTIKEPPRDWRDDPNAVTCFGLVALVVGVFVFFPLAIMLQNESGRARLAHDLTSPPAVGCLAILVLAAGLHAAWRWGPARSLSAPDGLVTFRDVVAPGRRVTLRQAQLDRALLITGRPGCGKSTILAEVGVQGLRRAAATAAGRPAHTVVFDANRTIAERMAYESMRLGRQTIVMDLGNRHFLTPIQFPRRGPGGAEAAAESIRRAWFSFQAEIPTQMYDALLHIFKLLAASGDYGLEQSIRVLRSPAFRDHLLSQGGASLTTHMGAWVGLIAELPRSEWFQKFWSTLARLFGLLESEPARMALAGRAGGFSFEHINDPTYAGPGIDVIITTSGHVNSQDVYFLFGILLNELSAVLHARLSPPAQGGWPEILILLDELGYYGSPEALLDLLARGRNVRVRLAGAVHSLTSLPEALREKVVVMAVNRIAGPETGPGAELTARQLYNYDPYLPAAYGPGGRVASYHSAEAQCAAFRGRLQHGKDQEFAVRLVNQEKTVWGRPLIDLKGVPGAAELSVALEEAACRSGRPVAELRAELNRENAELDRRFGPIDYRPDSGTPDCGDESWRERPDSDFAPF